MKKLLTFLVAFAAATAFAQTPQAVQSECARQMAMGICIAQNDGSSDAPGLSMLISGVGRVPLAAYRDYTRLANPDNPQDLSMCDLALTKMTAEPGGPHDLVARALWSPAAVEEETQQLAASPQAEAAMLQFTWLALVAATAFATMRRSA